MKRPFVSVVVPAYNEEKFIGACIESLLNQDFPREDFEIVLVDNNCVDNTVAIAKKMGVRVVKEKRQGLVFALIRGIKESWGDIIVILNADSEASPSWLSRIVGEYQKDPSIVGVSHLIDYQPKNFLAALAQLISDLAVVFVLKSMVGGHMSFRRDAYLKVGGYSSKVLISEDIYITKKLRKVGKIKLIRERLVKTSSRRFLNFRVFLPYAFKMLISPLGVVFLNRSFFSLSPYVGNIKRKK